MVARISRGRTLRELVLHTLILPIVTCLVWFSIWGGIGLRQSRQALELETLGGTYFNDTRHFSVTDSDFCYNVPQDNVEVNDEVIFTNHLPGVTPVCQFDASKSSTASFNVLHSFTFPDSFKNGGFGPTLAVVYILALTLFFVTSSDSGALIVDHLASNGSKSHHWVRRMFWSVTQGALSTALLSSGGATALKAVQAMAILCGLPYIILMMFMVQSTLLLCRAADKLPENDIYNFPDQAEFIMPVYGGIFNSIEYLSSFGYVNKERVQLGIDRPLRKHVMEFIKGVLVPSVSLYQILAIMNPKNRSLNFGFALIYAILYYAWIVLLSIPGSYYGFTALSSILFVSCGLMLGTVRNIFRCHYNNIRSNCAADFCAGLILWPQALSQMRLHAVMIQQQIKIKADDDEGPQPWKEDEMSDSISLSLSVPN
jgi:BCCT, betaine/carnitine/choline family transporter